MPITDDLVPFTPRNYPQMVDGDGAKSWAVDSYRDIGNSVTVIVEKMRALEAASADVGHTHVIDDVTGLQDALDALDAAKSDVGHTHVMADITDLATALAGKAALSHTHAISDVTSLQSTLDAKETYGEYNAITTLTTSGTLALTHKGNLVEMDSASSETITVPPNSSVAFPLKSRVDLCRFGAGELSIAAGVGVTIHSEDAKLRLNKQYCGGTLYKRDTNEWVLIGALKT